ncbi:hypothetical protein [Piscinibacter koreensis]|uniref:Uncharacterized protein n=1 Tax=Piscinibacter koreensis TaxID=2742824 RepID=A0A7Y6NNV6_9BURK|nr:hypothetical protein [Schlegelella koreensis]NUZ06551.1 hypothetical protein [Schlegelella koreensis]
MEHEPMLNQSSPTAAEGRTRSPDKPSHFQIKFSPLDLLKIVGGMVVLLGLLLHLVGVATHSAYLREWGVEAALFPRPLDRVLIDGYEVLLVSGLKISILPNLLILVAFAAAVTLYWTAFGEASRRIDAMEAAPAWLERLPRWAQLLSARFVVVLGITIAVPLAMWLISYFLAQPVVLAENSGKAQAAKQREQFAKGCQAATPTGCFELRRGTELVARGLLIDGSQEYIAFYDVGTSGVRVVPRQGTSFVRIR